MNTRLSSNPACVQDLASKFINKSKQKDSTSKFNPKTNSKANPKGNQKSNSKVESESEGAAHIVNKTRRESFADIPSNLGKDTTLDMIINFCNNTQTEYNSIPT